VTIYLVRHGQDTDNAKGILNGRRDTQLTPLGRKQAYIVGDKLRDNMIHAIYASPLQRALETANLIGEKLSINEVIRLPDLIERDFGVLTGNPVTDIPRYCKKFLATDRVNYFLEAEGAESFPQLYERAERVLKQIKSKHPYANVVVVTHGDIGKIMRAAFHGWSWEEGLKAPFLDNTGVLELSPQADIFE
jgi:broad specificity phosphatase PhoE